MTCIGVTCIDLKTLMSSDKFYAEVFAPSEMNRTHLSGVYDEFFVESSQDIRRRLLVKDKGV